jgi:hypothetical protein
VQSLLKQGHYLVLLILQQPEELEYWRDRLHRTQAERLLDYPYAGFIDSVREAV